MNHQLPWKPCRVFIVIATALLAITSNSSAQSYDKFFSFRDARLEQSASVANKGSGASSLIRGTDGNFYGTTGGGGGVGCGTVFKMTPAGVLTTLVVFTGSGPIKGEFPSAALVQGSDGNFYGTTESGGTFSSGTVFKMTPAGVLTTLVEFTGNGSSNKGKAPSGAMVQGIDGNFYGTTRYGGALDDGTVFKMTAAGVLTTLVQFTDNGSSNRGAYPHTGLIQRTDGVFWGTTAGGGASGYGTVFKMTAAGVLTTMVEFTYNGTSNKGTDPSALVQGNDGNLYGMTPYGGEFFVGTVFRMTLSGVLTTLVEFTGDGTNNKGAYPNASLIRGNDGNFYGTTGNGGASDDGTVFKMTPAGELTTLVEFTGNEATNKGSHSRAVLVQESNGNFWGTTGSGGASDCGTVFKMTPAGALTTLVELTGDGVSYLGDQPGAGVIRGTDGNFYGTTRYGGDSGQGTVFRMTPVGELTTLIEFTGNGASNKGSFPAAALVQGSDGNFYGTTESGGAFSDGTVFKMTPTGLLTTLVEFNSSASINKGRVPIAALVQGSDGNFYGTTRSGGTSARGTVFKMTPAGVLTTLVNFTGNGSSNKGEWPSAALVLGSDGNFYGTTIWGGAFGNGTVFKMTPAGLLTTLVEFTGNGSSNKGLWPAAALVQRSDGNFYGTTRYYDFSDSAGTVFKMTPAGVLTTLVIFSGNGASNKGSDPSALVQGTDGNLYGTTRYGGATDSGTVFKMTPTGVLATLTEFTADNGSPQGPLIQNTDGSLYGTTQNTFGTIFRMVYPGAPQVFQIQPQVQGASSALVRAKTNARGTSTSVALEYGTNGVQFPTTVSASPNLTGYQTTLVGATLNNLPIGTTYYYRFRAVSSAGTTISPVQSFSTPPANDNLANAKILDLSSGSVSVVSNNVGATGETGEVAYDGSATQDKTVWFRISIPVGATVSISTEGSNFDTTLSVFRQTSSGLSGLESLHGNDNAEQGQTFSRLRFFSNEGSGEYFIAVAGASSSSGNIVLSLEVPPTEPPLAAYEKVISFTDALDDSEAVRRNGGLSPFQLIQGPDGSFYGCTRLNFNGSSGPNVFRIDPDGEMSTLFTTKNGVPGVPFESEHVELLELGFDGNLYGISAPWGGNGLVFRVSRFGDPEVLTQFSGESGATRGAAPKLLFQAREGSLYGATSGGGYGGMGTLFRMSATGNHEVLVDFSGTAGSQRGEQVEKFFEAADGNFFGITSAGGSNDLGTIFRMTPAGSYQVLADFTGASGPNRGSSPFLLSSTRDGNLYGATRAGGSHGAGTIFRINTSTGAHQVLADLPAGYAGLYNLFEKPDGTFVGVVTDESAGPPAVFTASVFTMGVDGSLSARIGFGAESVDHGPLTTLLMAADGDLYGTFGSSYNFDEVENEYSSFIGNIFKVGSTGGYEELHRFGPNRDENDGENPNFLIIGRDGALYGCTSEGGRGERLLYNGQGVVFRITQDEDGDMDFRKVVQFGLPIHPAVPRSPRAAILEGEDGSWYGTSCWGGTDDYGTIFRITPAGEISLVKSMLGNDPVFNPGPFDGIFPMGELTAGSNGALTGISTITRIDNAGSGAFHDSCFFNLDADDEVLVSNDSVYSAFDIADYSSPGFNAYPYGVSGGLTYAGDGYFYGTSPAGVLRIGEEGDAELLGDASITGNLVESSDAQGRFFYGAEKNKILKIRPSGGTAVFATVNATEAVAPNIVGGLFKDTDGTLYGTTAEGGANGHGTLFKVSLAGVVTKMADFSGNGPGIKGAKPLAALMKHSDGCFYGTTSRGGAGDRGTIFRMTGTGVVTTVFEFEADERDSVPTGRLVTARDGNLYGTTRGAGEKIDDGLGDGGVYRLVFDGPPAVYPMAGMPLDPGTYQIRGRFNPRGASTLTWVDYWTKDEPIPKSVPLSVSFNGYKTREFGAALGNLRNGITYSYRLRAVSARGATSSEEMHFSTSGVPLVTLGTATYVTRQTALLHATVNARNAATRIVFEYGTNGTEFPFTMVASPDVVDGEGDNEVSAPIAELAPGSTCFYRVRATNSAGETVAGGMSFRTLIEADSKLGEAEALSTTRARVTGTVDALGSSAAVSFEWGVDGEEGMGDEDADYPHSASAVPGTVDGSGVKPVHAVMTGLVQGKIYHYRIRAEGPGGTGLSAKGTISLSILSGLVQVFPDPPLPSDGTVTVNFTPASRGGWRFEGETVWRKSGVAANHLASGKRLIEFLPVTGYIRPPQETLDVTSTADLTLDRIYYQTPSAGDGGLTVLLKPEGLGGKWRIVGEAAWRDSGAYLTSWSAGSYLVECKPVAGRDTPQVVAVSIESGGTRQLTLTYYTTNTTGAAVPQPVSFNSVSADEDLPFAYVGQIRSAVGSSTGFVVKRRVVATAGHVVFDDGALAYLTNLQWLLQRHVGRSEPQPQVPRGYYLAAGYADQRIADASPGAGSPQSQNLDYAALYFSEEAGRGGYGGYLASDSGDDNEFLDSTAQKILAGYAVDGIVPADQGKLHATAPFTAPLSPAFGETWTTTAVRGQGGCSGGPLFVRH
ncbi:MAG: choice-of-anchor tandem repeat GloVer-containing protein, partial [Verrucomicrobiota bacterium]